MNKGKLFFLCLVVAIIFAAGCGKSDSDDMEEGMKGNFNTEDEVLGEDIEPKEEPEHEEPEPAQREIVDGKIRSYFTGEWIDAELGTKRPLAIMLNNSLEALPMSGPSGASVIYECPVEGRITRWMGIFEDWENISRIGSVRSCRLYYLHFAQSLIPYMPTLDKRLMLWRP